MKKLSPKILLLIAGVLSILSALLVYYFLSSAEKPNKIMKNIIVANVDIEAGKKITADMLKPMELPTEAIQEDAIVDLDSLVGRYAKSTIYKGEQITEKRLNTPINTNSFIMSIPDDKRAITIKVDDIDTIAGFLRPGSYVDVVSVEDVDNKYTSGKLLFQNILVLAVGKTNIISDDINNQDASAGNVTLALSADDAVRLRVAQQLGHISLMLRPVNPKNNYVLGADYIDGYKTSQSSESQNKAVSKSSNTMNDRVVQPTYRKEDVSNRADSVAVSTPKSEGIRIIRGTEIK